MNPNFPGVWQSGFPEIFPGFSRYFPSICGSVFAEKWLGLSVTVTPPRTPISWVCVWQSGFPEIFPRFSGYFPGIFSQFSRSCQKTKHPRQLIMFPGIFPIFSFYLRICVCRKVVGVVGNRHTSTNPNFLGVWQSGFPEIFPRFSRDFLAIFPLVSENQAPTAADHVSRDFPDIFLLFADLCLQKSGWGCCQ